MSGMGVFVEERGGRGEGGDEKEKAEKGNWEY